MKSNAYAWFARLLVAGISLLAAHGAQALAITHGSMTISNIQISAGAGTLDIDPWTAQASATANNSLGESDGQFDSQPSVARADAMVTWADGHSAADAIGLTTPGSSSVNLPGSNNQADSTGRGSLFTTFTVTGGTGDVNVMLSMDIDGSQDGFTDNSGSFMNEIVAVLELDGDPKLFYDNIIHGGPGSNTTIGVNQTLSNTLTLSYDTPYFIFIEADSESNAMNVPEPGTLVLMLAGLGMLAGVATRR